MNYPLDSTDRRLIAATQTGLPLSIRPYHDLAQELGLSAKEVMQRIERMISQGIIRRIGVVPNHYALGYTANGMSVWDLPDDEVRQAGMEIGVLDFVSHCYQRPRHPSLWPYNLFAMVHGRSRDEVQDKVERIAGMLGDRQRGHNVLYSTRILKKTGLRITQKLAAEKNV
ncbi:MAG: Lrp/AsnC family transcriptional regulator [Gammaproteobacteria bacterium]|nr:Lrp/AsnC family transcriptional regulator [Gammaproteobacteria bacterium]